MTSSDDDRLKGTANNLGGKVKEGLGKLSGDKSLESEGHMDQAKGNAQKAWGDVKDALTPDKK